MKAVGIKQLGFTQSDFGVYAKVVKKDELDSIYEVKSPILGFK